MTDPETPVVDSRPTSQLDLERRLAAGHRTEKVNVGPLDDEDNVDANPAKVSAPFAVEGNDTSAYIGVSPEYMTYADETHRPFSFDEGVEADSVKEMLDDQFAVGKDEPLVGEKTLGGGSNEESIYSHTSGSDVTAVTVDREKLAKDAEKAKDKKESKPSVPSRPTPQRGVTVSDQSK